MISHFVVAFEEHKTKKIRKGENFCPKQSHNRQIYPVIKNRSG